MTRRARNPRRGGGAAQAQPEPTPAPVAQVQSSSSASPPPPPPPAADAATAAASTPSAPLSTAPSPTGSVLLPPVEIEISPRHSLHSSYSSSSAQARARASRASATSSDEEEEDEENEGANQPQGTSGYSVQDNRTVEEVPGTHHKHFNNHHHYDRHHEYHPQSSSQRKNRGLWSKQKVHPAGSASATGQSQDEIETSVPRSGQVEGTPGGGGGGGSSGGLRKSASKGSITVKSRGCFGRMRRSPNFILFTVFLALFVDMATYGIIVPIIPFIVSDNINGGATDTGLLLAIYAIGILISSPLFGVLGDSFVSRRVPMLIGLVGMLISTALFMVASNFYVFLAARLLQGVAGGSVWTLGLALITDVFPAHTLGVQMGKALVGYTLGLMMGPPLGGLLYEQGGYQAPFLFVCVITLIDFGCRALIIEEREEIVKALKEQGKQEEANEELAEVVALRKKEREENATSFWRLLQNKRLLACVVVTACNAFVFSGAEPTVPLHLAATFNMTSGKIGLVFMAFSLPTLTAPFSGALSDRFGAKIVCLISLIVCGTCVILLGVLANSLTMIILLFTLIGITGTAILTPVLGELSAVVRTTGQGDGFARAYAIFNMAFSIGVLIGPVVCGLVYEHFGFEIMTFTMAGILLLATPVVILWIGDLAQKKRDLVKYKEDEDRRRLSWRRSASSRYSLEFSENIEDAELGWKSQNQNQQEGTSPPSFDHEVVEKNLEDKLAYDLSKDMDDVEQKRVPRDDILKSARMDAQELS